MTSQAIPHGSPAARPRRRSRSEVPATRPRVRSLVIFVLAVILAFFAMIYSRISLDRTAFELQDLDSQITEQQHEMDRMRVQVARRLDPIRITERAEEMGLVYPADRIPLIVELGSP